ncbi:hypothetical protein [Helicobacter sp. T3_23-1059]
MDNNIQKLQQIGLKEISKQTRISNSRLKDIFEQNFSNFKRVHLVGFLQILEREYKLDLSSVLQAYDNFHENGGIQYSTDNTQESQYDTQNLTNTSTSQTPRQAPHSTQESNTKQTSQKEPNIDTSFDFGVGASESKAQQETPKKEIPQIDLRLSIDEPQKQDEKESQEPKSSKLESSESKKPKSQKSKKTIQNEVSFDTQKRRYDSIDTRKKEAISKQRFYLTIVCTIIAVLIYLIYQNLSSKNEAKNESNYDFGLPEDITKPNYNEQSQSQEGDMIQSEGMQEIKEENPSDTQTSEQNIESNTQDSNAQQNLVNDISTQSQLQSLQPTQSTTNAQSQAPQIAGKMVIKAENMLWFDIVDLDTNRRKYQGVTSDTYSIDKDDNHKWLLAFGHSNFSLSMNGAVVEVPRLDIPLYFIYEPGSGFRRIDNVTYKRLSDQAR